MMPECSDFSPTSLSISRSPSRPSTNLSTEMSWSWKALCNLCTRTEYSSHRVRPEAERQEVTAAGRRGPQGEFESGVKNESNSAERPLLWLIPLSTMSSASMYSAQNLSLLSSRCLESSELRYPFFLPYRFICRFEKQVC